MLSNGQLITAVTGVFRVNNEAKKLGLKLVPLADDIGDMNHCFEVHRRGVDTGFYVQIGMGEVSLDHFDGDGSTEIAHGQVGVRDQHDRFRRHHYREGHGMTEDQYKALDSAKKIDLAFYLTVGLFSNDFSDRTLLYGYDVDRVTWHLYIEDGDVRLLTIDGEAETFQNLSREPVARSHLQSAIIPNKRLYPERCDYDFCVWAKEEGLHLSFTTFDATRAVKNGDYYGEV